LLLSSLALLVSAMPASATEAGIGYSVLTYVCPTPDRIDFAWAPADGATFYSLQLVDPVDPTINGGVTGTYLRQFGSLEVAKGGFQNFTVMLASGSIPLPEAETWQVMAGGKKGYLGLVPRTQTVSIPMPCTANTVPVVAS